MVRGRIAARIAAHGETEILSFRIFHPELSEVSRTMLIRRNDFEAD